MINYQKPPLRKVFLGFTHSAISINTAEEMRRIIHESSKNHYVRSWAEHMISGIPDRDSNGEIQAIFLFIQKYMRYTNDPLGIEYVQTPPFILEKLEKGITPNLDCDDYTVLGLSLLRSLGYDTAIRLTGYNSKEFEHVYGMVYDRKYDDWIPFDAIRKDKPFRWEAPNPKVVFDIEI